MKKSGYFGIILLLVLWIWLVQAIIRHAGGLTAYNIFVIIASGIIIFVPIYKKYFKNKDTDSNSNLPDKK